MGVSILISDMLGEAGGFTRVETTSIVRHECGHLIVAKLLGFQTGEISLTSAHGHASIDLHPSISSISDLVTFAERRIKVLLAGAMAESLKKGKVDTQAANKLLEGGTSANDFAKVRELVRVLTGTLYPNSLKSEFAGFLTSTNERVYVDGAKLVEQQAPLISKLTVHFMNERDKDAKERKASVGALTLTSEAIASFFAAQP